MDMGGDAMATQLCPNILVSDIARSMRFYEGVGYKEVHRVNGPTGGAVWVALEREGHRIFLEVAPPGQKLGATVQFYLDVADVGGEAARLKDARIEYKGPETKPYGMTEIAFHDPDGYDWIAGQHTGR
jgi:catechol 2,3-dioxygenase-like lactoylglutathione lyase family enzyme